MKDRLVTNISEIGEAFKMDESMECATKINHIMNEDYNVRSRYEYNIKSKVMEN